MNWQLQEAKNRLSEVVKAAKTKGPQIITVRGKEEVAVVSIEELRRLTPNKESLFEFLRNSPLRGVELNIERSRDSEDRDIGL
ncbi:MAG TPA: type II toxin-antitoxin system Phd/YefM family antitoxin [Dokdonella sp.]|uniref:type II toxin-antitoxin system Phd/YefM family antitoxin n=1 Tax=Dokdonella sp. TaxID=2291710 RepID=UPI002D7E24DF|nr:type II toxin-antitoxin system Phd/YefM family antitoxin [Dokdonella sp.]HET9033610.1 type II toxin-antitoxin system Phd/YefM family antitoxin [Dokdonella sp.]